MEEKEAPPTETPQEQPKANPPAKKMSYTKIFVVFIAILFMIAFLIGGFYFGSKQAQNNPSPTPIASDTSNDQSPTPTTTSSSSPTPSPIPGKSVEAGGDIGVFMPYRITVPNDWTSSRTSTPDVMDVLTISKGSYKITVSQAGGEGSICNYGSPSDEPFSTNYKTYVEFQSLDEDLRRSGETGGTGWTICHKTNNGWGFPTLYGYISYANPANSDEVTLKQMDSILSTITKQ